MASEPLKHTQSGSMVQTVAGRPEPDSGPGTDLPAVWISPQTHQKYTVLPMRPSLLLGRRTSGVGI